MMGKTDKIPWWDETRNRWRIEGNLMYAAWLPYWRRLRDKTTGQILEHTPCFNEPFSLEHGQAVRVNLQKVRRPPFFYWRVMQITPEAGGTGPIELPSELWNGHSLCSDVLPNVRGYVCITNHNTENKHDERVFFDKIGRDSYKVQLNSDSEEDLRLKWRDLIDNYQDIHHDEITKKGRKGPPASPLSRWSRHITNALEEAELKEGTLCYARVESIGKNQFKVIGLYPVMISRTLYEVPPRRCLPVSLHPPASVSKLSPADRVFGWVRQAEDQGERPPDDGAHKGQLRIGPVQCLTPAKDAIEEFGDPGFPLGILGEPKPQQSRFYMAEDENGTALRSSSEPTYSEGRGLRGRKVYPHHSGLPADYWNHGREDWTQRPPGGSFYQEYRRPHRGIPEKDPRVNPDGTFQIDTREKGEQPDDQNRSIQGWVKTGTRFFLEIDVTNLSRVELGALLFLLTLPPGHHHRLGGGKPLGFGSVRLEIADPRLPDDQAASVWPLGLYSGESQAEWFGSLSHDPVSFRTTHGLQRDTAESLIGEFKRSVIEAFDPSSPSSVSALGGDLESLDRAFRSVGFIAAFLRATTGFQDGLPIHYPRARRGRQPEGASLPPHPGGKGYEWFEANRRSNQPTCLEDLATDRGLPYLREPGRS